MSDRFSAEVQSWSFTVPRFFIDTDDGDLHVHDDEGADLPNSEAAREAAIGVLPDMARSKLPNGDRCHFVATVRDEAGTAIYTATLALVGHWIGPVDKM